MIKFRLYIYHRYQHKDLKVNLADCGGESAHQRSTGINHPQQNGGDEQLSIFNSLPNLCWKNTRVEAKKVHEACHPFLKPLKVG
jgi:hypothetical protein